jgi:hypothetical protein
VFIAAMVVIMTIYSNGLKVMKIALALVGAVVAIIYRLFPKNK